MKRLFITLLALLAFATTTRADDKVLNVYCWDEYLPKDVLEDFTKRTGVKVTLTLYDSNEAMLAKVGSGVTSYDLVFPSEYAVRVLAEKKLVRELDKSKIPNWKNLDPRLLDKNYDPGNKFAMPYFCFTTRSSSARVIRRPFASTRISSKRATRFSRTAFAND